MSVPGVRRLQGVEADDGRRARLEALFTSHAAAVFAFARRRASAAEADEVVSETFLVAWRRIDDVPDHALPWLLNIARKTLANRRRSDARRHALVVRIAASADEAVADDAASTDGIRAALAALPALERDALTLIAWDGLSPAEAAVVLSCSRGALYIRLHRGRRRLARRLAADASEGFEGSEHVEHC